MAEIWNNPIDKKVDWGGDESTNGLPVSGEQVQKFIKKTLDQKAGVFYYDNTNNRYLVFADEDARDTFLMNPTQTELVLGTFDAPFNYSAEINLVSPAYNAVFIGSTGNYIDFTFDIKNKSGVSTGENVTITYSFIRNATKQTYTEVRKFGDSVHFNVDKYIGEGTNTIIIGVTGQTSLAATTAAVTYQVVNLTFKDELDISKVYDLRNGSQEVAVPFTVSGYGTKVVEWYLDGEILPFVKAEDEIVDVVVTRTKYISLSNLQQGVHTVQMRAYAVINGEKFYTDTLYREIFVYTGVSEGLMLAVAVDIPSAYGVIGAEDNVAIYGMVQYVPYTLRFATFIPSNAANTEMTISFDGDVRGVVSSSNNVVNEFVIIPSSDGNKILNISSANTSRDIRAVVSETTMNIYEIQNGLTLDFNAQGKSNNSADRTTWSGGRYTGTLTGFNWNNSSGWVNGRLEINAGASFGINYAPLAGLPTETGKTIEIEWATKNVTNDEAIVCDLRNDDGTGILIKATKVVLTSADGVTIETEYKSGENVRIAFVINKASGTANKHMSFIYANGVVSRGETWAATDSYTSNKEILFEGTPEATVSLKAIRVYDVAFNSSDVLNNFILYRDTVEEMMEVYDRNDVFNDGTVVFSPEKMMGRLPVMIVTGDIPTLENTSDKDTQIIVDIEYHNMQDISKSFTMKKAAMRPQGTSSMGYPKKNFRIYTQKSEDTQLFDSNGALVENKLYSFKEGSQPVNCWCLKADYAESSGTHNTGIARLWNTALYNAQIDGEYKLRTEAQKKAAEVDYPYDVRTTIDGFPILLFYRLSTDDDLIFIGKYNFNNDKSTESVFGFTDIPNFDNSKMQCWEILNNGNALALFTTTEGFDEGWKEAFESRYPDTKTPYTGDLKAFCEWMTNVSSEDFSTQKWEHLNVYMIAAYWCYLMRHAAADQFVKNAMLTSEDGQHFFFILYDNDTINGLINTGDIRISPTDDRQTVDESGAYVFAGHDSRLWNMLEADEEFQEIVAKVDNALYSAGISYVNSIKMFDEEQAGKWVERVYNRDAEYKYIGPYSENGINNLFMLQGKRDLHRRWWLAKRYSIYDAKYVSGTYKSEAIEIKCLNGTQAGQEIVVTSGYPFDYGYGINNLPRESGVKLNEGESYTFVTNEVVNVGDPIRIYGAPNIAELDLSFFADRIVVLNMSKAYSDTLGAKMTKLVLGKNGVNNYELGEISGLKGLVLLEYLDIQGMKAMSSVDLTNQSQMKTLKAFGSGASSILFAEGAPIERAEMPSTLRALKLNQHPNISRDNIIFENGMSGISSIDITGCPNLCNDFNWIYTWYSTKTATDEYSSLVMDNVDWKNVDVEKLVALTNLSKISLKGKVKISEITLEQANRLLEIFGESAFNKDAEFYIDAPDAIFIIGGETNLIEGESAKYTCVTFGAEAQVTYQIYSGKNSYMSIDENTGVLTTSEGAAESSSGKDIVIRAIATSVNGTNYANRTVHIEQRTYPSADYLFLYTNSYIENDTNTFKLNTYQPELFNGDWYIKWQLTGLDGYAEIDTHTNEVCVVRRLQQPEISVSGTIKASLCRRYNNSVVASKSLATSVLNDTIAEIDAGAVVSLYNAGLCASSAYITKEEAALVTDTDIATLSNSSSSSIFYSNGTSMKYFYGFQHFTGITTIPKYLLQVTSNLNAVSLPKNATVLTSGWFGKNNTRLLYIYIPASVTTISTPFANVVASGAFTSYVDVDSENQTFVSELGALYSRSGSLYWFNAPNVVSHFTLPAWVNSIQSYAFCSNDMILESLHIHEGVSLSGNWLYYVDVRNLYWGTNAYGSYTISAPKTAECSLYLGKNVDELYVRSIYTYNSKFSYRVYVEEGGLLKRVGDAIYTLKNHLVVALQGVNEFILPEGITSIAKYAFRYTSTSKIFFPEGLEEIPESCWYDTTTVRTVDFPSTLKAIGSYAFYSVKPTRIISRASIPPTIGTNTFYFGSSSVSPKIPVEIPVGTKEAYEKMWGTSKLEFIETYEPTECTSLIITAEDVVGNKTFTRGTFYAMTNGVDITTGETVTNRAIYDVWESEPFELNTSDEAVAKEVSFTYLGKTASTVINHGVWKPNYYEVDLNDGEWGLTTTPANPDSTLYDGVYRSVKGYRTANGVAIMYIDLYGAKEFKLYMRAYCRSTTDWLMVSQIDQEINGNTDYADTTLVKAHSYNKSTSGTSISNYKLVEFTDIDETQHHHRITIVYRRGSNASYGGDDRGYILIPKDQE